MRVFRPFAIAAAALIVATPAWAGAKPNLKTLTAETIVATWKCQDQLHPELPLLERRTAARSPWKPHNHSFRVAELNRWKLNYRSCSERLQARKQVVRRLNAGIAAYYRSQRRTSGPLTGQGQAIEAAGRRHDVSPYFMVAASITESSAGLAACSGNQYNIWGLSSCGSGWHVPPDCARQRAADCWHGWGDAFDFYARFLTGGTSVTRGWPEATSPYHYHGYARCSECWGRKTSGHMQAVFAVEPYTRYPG